MGIGAGQSNSVFHEEPQHLPQVQRACFMLEPLGNLCQGGEKSQYSTWILEIHLGNGLHLFCHFPFLSPVVIPTICYILPYPKKATGYFKLLYLFQIKKAINQESGKGFISECEVNCRVRGRARQLWIAIKRTYRRDCLLLVKHSKW